MKPIHGRQMSLFDGSSLEISIKRAARMLNRSPDTIMRLIEAGKLKAYQMRERGWWTVSFDSVVAYRNFLREKFALDIPTEAESSANSADSAPEI